MKIDNFILKAALELTGKAVQLNQTRRCSIDVQYSSIGNWVEFWISASKKPGDASTLFTVRFDSGDAYEQLEKIGEAFDFIYEQNTFVHLDEVDDILEQ